ncbi:MAG: sigma-70 family RNA polymerase sigma factor [Phycisphaerales bacterium]|nr:sigma-70 family RNA polymerase sigma factor [Phycisphaerales bacterium]
MEGLTGRLLAALRGGDRRAENDAVAELLKEMRRRATPYAPSRGQRVDAQLDSVVQSVLADALPKAIDRCEDDEGLKRYLGRAVRNRFVDRAKRRRGTSLDASDDSSIDPRSPDPGPATVVFSMERGDADEEGRAAFEHAIRTAKVTTREREIATLFVLRQYAWDQVAAAVGMTSGAAKVAMTRMRPRLLESVLAPMESELSPPNWRILKLVLIDGRSEDDAAATLQFEPERVFAAFRDAIVPALRQRYGGFGVERLDALRLRAPRAARAVKTD